MNELYNSVSEKYIQEISNLNIENKSLLITFSGIPGSGKSTVAKQLSKELKGVCIASDRIQQILEEIKGEQFFENYIEVKREFVYWLINKIAKEEENKLIILDKAVDRTYEDIKKLSEDLNLPLVLISLNSNIEEIKKRLIERHDNHVDDYFKELDRWKLEFENFRNQKKYTLEFDTEKERVENIVEKIIEYLKTNSLL